MEILIPIQKVPVLAEADVVVCGGGSAGIAAAICAARHGAAVILIERWPFVGGMATAALVNIWHRSDRQKMVIYGLVEEIAQRAVKNRWMWQKRNFPRGHETHWFEPEGMKLLYHEMLEEAGVRTFCYTVAGEPVVSEGRMQAVLVDTKRGRRAIAGRFFIDATGDGDIAAKAGLPFDFGRTSDGRVQGMTMMFSVRDIDLPRVRANPPQVVDEIMGKMRQLRDSGRFPYFNETAMRGYISDWARNFDSLNLCPGSGDPLDEEVLTKQSAKCRSDIKTYLDFWQKNVPGMEKVELVQTGFSIGIRESRRIRGLKTLDRDMVLGAVKQPDAIGHGIWMIDIHDPMGTGYTTWNDRNEKTMLKEGTSYHIPLGMCLNDRIGNLAVVGRCASSTHEGHSSVRVQTHCMVMGQGVGTAAAMAMKKGIKFTQIDIRELQATLIADGVYLKDIPE